MLPIVLEHLRHGIRVLREQLYVRHGEGTIGICCKSDCEPFDVAWQGVKLHPFEHCIAELVNLGGHWLLKDDRKEQSRGLLCSVVFIIFVQNHLKMKRLEWFEAFQWNHKAADRAIFGKPLGHHGNLDEP